MAKVAKTLQGELSSAFPDNVILVGTLSDDGFVQISPRGSVIVFGDDTLGFWNRGTGKTHEAIRSGSKVTFYFRKSELRKNGLLPKGGIARFYGVAELYKEGQVREEVYERMPEAEKERDPQKLGSAVLVKIERAEDLSGEPLNIE